MGLKYNVATLSFNLVKYLFIAMLMDEIWSVTVKGKELLKEFRVVYTQNSSLAALDIKMFHIALQLSMEEDDPIYNFVIYNNYFSFLYAYMVKRPFHYYNFQIPLNEVVLFYIWQAEQNYSIFCL
ncbi:hypothetical protein ACJX0J_029138, partial [Zea mays]